MLSQEQDKYRDTKTRMSHILKRKSRVNWYIEDTVDAALFSTLYILGTKMLTLSILLKI